MRSMEDYDLILKKGPKEEVIHGGVGKASLFMRHGGDELPDCGLDSMADVMHAINIMSNGWLLLGTARVQSSRFATRRMEEATKQQT